MGDADIVRALLESGASVNIRGKCGFTALMTAAQKTHAECVHTLIEAGADVNIRSTCDSSALTVAVQADSLRNLVQDTDTESLKCIQFLLRAGARINTGYQFKTLFTQASDADKNTLQVPALLLAAGEHLEVEQIKDVIYNPEGEILLFIPDGVKQRRRGMAMKTTCRRRIRNHLLELDPHRNLFLRVEQLPLPENLTSYLVQNVSLDTELWEWDWDFW